VAGFFMRGRMGGHVWTVTELIERAAA